MEMSALEYFKEKKRLTKSCLIKCKECPLSTVNNSKNMTCNLLEKEYPELAIKAIQKWSKENPKKTYLDDFLEKLPNAMINGDGVPCDSLKRGLFVLELYGVDKRWTDEYIEGDK